MEHVKEGGRQIAAGGAAGKVFYLFLTMNKFRFRGSMSDAPIGCRKNSITVGTDSFLQSFGCVQENIHERQALCATK